MTHILKKTIIALALCTASIAPGAHAADQLAEVQLMQEFMSVMQGYYDLIGQIHDVSANPSSATIIKMQKLDEAYKELGDRDGSIRMLRKVLSDSDDAVVRSAAVIMLADALKETGRTRVAIDVLQASLEEDL